MKSARNESNHLLDKKISRIYRHSMIPDKRLFFSGMFKELKESIQSIKESLVNYKALKRDSPETAALALKLAKSEEGQFVIGSGVLTPAELANLSRLQLMNFLNATTTVVRMLGKEAFIESIPETRKAMLKKLKIDEIPNRVTGEV